MAALCGCPDFFVFKKGVDELIEDVLNRLDSVRTSGKGYTARCPSHSDKSPSLYISQAEDRVLMYCYAGCTVQDICRSIDLNVSDLFMDKKKMPPAKRKQIETKIDTRKQFEELRKNAFLAMAEFKSDTEKVVEGLGLDIAEGTAEAVHMLPQIDYWMGILAVGEKDEIINLIKEGVVAKWARLWTSQKTRPTSSLELILQST